MSAVFLVLIISSVALLPTLDASCYDVGGIITTVFTPSNEDGSLNLDIIPQYAQYLKDKGIDGVVVAATSGEGPTLNVSDNKLLLDAWMEAAPPLGLYVISSVGAVPFPDTIEMTAYSEKIGVDAILALPEVYYKPKNAIELLYYMTFVSKAARNTPLLYDNFPEYSGVYVDIEEFFELATEKLPNFKGVKSNVFEDALRLRTKVNSEQKIYIADYRNLAPGFYMGFRNFIMNAIQLFPTLVNDVIRSDLRGDRTHSLAAYQIFVNRMDDIIEEGNKIAARKTAMTLISGVDVGPVRPPIFPLSGDQKEDLEERLRDHNVPIYSDK